MASDLFADIAGLESEASSCSSLDNLKVSYGTDELTPTTTAAPPSVQWQDASEDKTYTLIMTDPDAPSREKPAFREFIHWAVSGISGSQLQAGGSVSGTTHMEYIGPGPPYNSGMHRYLFLVFERPSSATPASFGDAFAGRGGKKAIEAAKAAGYAGTLKAASWFETTWDESVDAVHASIGFMPPEEYRSPKQKAQAAGAEKDS